MKKNLQISRILAAAFVILTALSAANSLLAQCGTYFKWNYRAINKLEGGFNNSDAFSDWNNDGRLDIWSTRRNPSTQYSDFVIYPAKPSGYWDWDNPIIYTTTMYGLASNASGGVRDYDGDGRKDFFDGFYIHRNLGDGSLTAGPRLEETDGSVNTIGFGNINGDNRLDWIYVVTSFTVPEIRYQLQNPDGSFGTKTIVLVNSAENEMANANKMLGDFNGDGLTDIVYGYNPTGNIYWNRMLKNVGGGNFALQPRVDNGFALTPPRDFNHDGRDDVLSVNSIFYGKADGTFNVVQLPNSPQTALLPAEINGDNNPDIMEVGSGFYTTLISDGAEGFTRTVYNRDIGSSLFMLIADFSGDGKADILTWNPFGIPNDNNNIFFERNIAIRENVCLPVGETRMANLDGNTTLDGAVKPDIAMWNPATGGWSSKNITWRPSADPTIRTFNWGLGAHGDVPALGDFDGDGTTDYSVYRDSTGEWYALLSATSTWSVIKFGLPGDIAVPNDYDGGGRSDIAVFRPSDGNWYIWFSETQSFGAVHFGTTGDKPVPADYDGDNKTDVAVFRPSEGNWYYLRSSDYNYVALHWGSATDKPLPADYDGDGRADLTVYRNGEWWIWRSSTNAFVVVQWGQAGDVPMPFYRSAISADLILYRPSTRTWHSFFSTYSGSVPFGGSGDVPVYFGLPNN
jgi:hypothetical protein